MKKTTRFRELLQSDRLEFLLEAHNGLSAKIGEEAGFQGLWASGLSLSAQFGVRDNNEASWTQVLEMLEFMADATTVPILLDGDTGYGNFNNMRRLVRKLEQRGVAAVCIEDKLFPKQNSFIAGEAQPLADVEEFCGKIHAAKDTQEDPDFCVVARVEAFIAGRGLDEALRRGDAYAEAGADAILIHSAKSVPDEVLAFRREWTRDTPVVIVPTKYYATPTDVFREAGFSLCIWANHQLRAAIGAMQATAATLMQEENLLAIEDRVVSVREVFRLQGADEMAAAERRYLPGQGARPRAIVLAASRGSELGEMTATRPKVLVEVNERTILDHVVDAYERAGIRDVTVVRGYAKETFPDGRLRYVDNDEYETTGELVSLQRALHALEGAGDDVLVVSYGDVLFTKFVPELLCDRGGDLAITVDTAWRSGVNRERPADYVRCSAPYSRRTFYEAVRLERMDEDLPEAEIHGEWMGFLKIAPAAQPTVRALVDRLLERPENRQSKLLTLLNALVADGQEVDVVYTSGHWLDVDSVADVVRAGSFR